MKTTVFVLVLFLLSMGEQILQPLLIAVVFYHIILLRDFASRVLFFKHGQRPLFISACLTQKSDFENFCRIYEVK